MSRVFESTAELRPRPATPNAFRVVGVVSAAALALLGCTSESHDKSTVQRESTTSTSIVPNRVGGSELKAWGEFASSDLVSDKIRLGLAAATIKVQTNTKACSGMIVNDLFISAAHCLPDNQESQKNSIQLYRWQDGFSAPSATVTRWGFNTGSDLFVGLVGAYEQYTDAWQIDHFQNEDPSPGESFVMTSLPGDASSPWWADLTYLGRVPGVSKGQLAFAVDPGVRDDVANGVARPGASGSIITNGRTSMAVVWNFDGQLTRDGTVNTDWASDRTYYQTVFGVDLSDIDSIVFGSKLNQTDVTNLAKLALQR